MPALQRSQIGMGINIHHINWCIFGRCSAFNQRKSIVVPSTNNNRDFPCSNNFFNKRINQVIDFFDLFPQSSNRRICWFLNFKMTKD
ncbi:hypothetical protein D3C87_852870 [compost metagenome]